jgi:hypothetical protein
MEMVWSHAPLRFLSLEFNLFEERTKIYDKEPLKWNIECFSIHGGYDLEKNHFFLSKSTMQHEITSINPLEDTCKIDKIL